MTVAFSLISRYPLKKVVLYRLQRSFTVLALESSADDTCAAILTSRREIMSNVVVKQHNVHASLSNFHLLNITADCVLFKSDMRDSAVFIPQRQLQATRCVIFVVTRYLVFI